MIKLQSIKQLDMVINNPSNTILSLPLVAPKKTLLFRISSVSFLLSLSLMIISIIFLDNNFTDALFFIIMGISLIMLQIKNHKIEGKIYFSTDAISIDIGKKKTFLMSDITKIIFRINEFKDQQTYILNPMMVYSEKGIYNYLEITTINNKEEKYEFFLTKKNFNQLNLLFDKLNNKLKDRLIIYYENKKVNRLIL